MKSSDTKEVLTIALKLLIICSIVAAIIAFVNAITKDKIEYNNKVKTALALSEIYSEEFGGKSFEVNENEYIIKDGDAVIASCISAECNFINDDINALYVLNDSEGNNAGYCVSISPMGFKDVINMLVAVNDDFTVKDVKIVSMSETSGYGTRAIEDANPPAGKEGSHWFLNQFLGRDEETAGNVDIISGATKSSKPIIGAVKTALGQVNVYSNSIGGASNE